MTLETNADRQLAGLMLSLTAPSRGQPGQQWGPSAHNRTITWAAPPSPKGLSLSHTGLLPGHFWECWPLFLPLLDPEQSPLQSLTICPCGLGCPCWMMRSGGAEGWVFFPYPRACTEKDVDHGAVAEQGLCWFLFLSPLTRSVLSLPSALAD